MTVSGAAGAEAAEGAAGAQEGAQGAQEGAQPDNAALIARMDEMSSQWNEFREQHAAVPPANEEGEPQVREQNGPGRILMDPESGEMYDTYTGQLVDNPYGGEELSPQQIEQLVAQRASEIAQQQVAPLNDYVLKQQYAAIEETYPAMRDEATAQKVIAQARQLAQAIKTPDAWQNPEFLEQVFLAWDARQRAETGDPVSGREAAALEDPSAAPGGASQEDADAYGDAIVNAGGGQNAEARRFFTGG